MKKHLEIIIMLSRFSFYGFVLQCLFMSALFAKEGNAQVKSVKDVIVNLNLKNERIDKVLKEIERQTEFNFVYTADDLLKHQQITIRSGGQPVSEALLEISRQANVKFRQVNNNISIQRLEEGSPEETQIEVYINDTKITGKVTDENGEGLPGATVTVKGTAIGTITDIDGNYQLTVPDVTATLVFSFVGYESREVTIDGRSSIDVSLDLDIQSLSEVVVIGYQTVQKKDLTGSTAIIKPSAANKVTANSLAESIQGLAPGVTVRNGGSPGQGAVIEIRGVGSFQDTNPLYVIDGMIADANPTINTNDIESIQILKDASAAAIYGSRAANGVIIITTKTGKEGPMKVSFSGKKGIQQIPNRWDIMDNEAFAEMQRTQFENSGDTPPALVADDFDPEVNTDWQEEMIQLGALQDYNLSLSGGSAMGSYMISGSYFDNQGVIKGYDFERYSFRINSKSKIGRVTFGENILLSHSINDVPGEGNPFYDMPQLLPVIPVQSEDYVSATNPEGWGIGSVGAPSYAWNPVAVNDLSRHTNRYSKLVGNAYVQVKITDWLHYKFNAGLEASFDNLTHLRKEGVWSFNAAPAPSTITEIRSLWTNRLLEHTINFDKTFGKHTINAVVGATEQTFKRDRIEGRGSDLQIFDGDYMTTIGSATGEFTATGGVPQNYHILGYLGRINYVYDNRYLLTLTGRIDQDSRFTEESRTGIFPSVAAGWRISEENFFNIGIISDLKLTASYGQLGVVPSNVGSWEHVGTLNSNTRAIFGPGQNPYVGAYQARITNPELRWESRTTQNLGVEAGFLENKILLTLELYNSLSEDALLSSIPLANYLGNLGGNPWLNAASIRNKGVEVSATYRKSEGSFRWDLSGNLTTIKNTVEDVGNQGVGIDYIQTGLTRSKIGRPVAEWYLLETDGIFQSADEVNDYTSEEGTLIQPFAQPGDIRFVDVNGDGQITDEDRTYTGQSPWPKLQAGSQFNASYLNFTFNLQLIGVFGNTIYNGVRQILDTYQNTNFRSDISPWTENNKDTDDPRIGVATDDVALSQNGSNSNRWLENGSYVRIRNIEVGYNVPIAAIQRIGVDNARVYVSGQNLLTLTKYSGLDPDVVGNGILERGFDSGNWPSSRVYSVGVQFQF